MYVCIDAGHGGHDSGAVLLNDEGVVTRRESEDNLRIAIAIRNALEYRGIPCAMTRLNDVFLSHDSRLRIARACDLTISVHRNSAASAARGFETFLWNGTSEGDSTRIWAYNMATAIEGAGMPPRPTAVRIGAVNDQGDYDTSINFLINAADTQPSMLAEFGFISSAEDNELIDNNNSLNAIATAVAQVTFVKLIEMFGEGNPNLNPSTGGGRERPVTVTYTEGAATRTTSFDIQVASALQVSLGSSQDILPVLESEESLGENLFWTSSNPSVATVSEDGIVSGVAEGIVIISAVAENGELATALRVNVVAREYEVTELVATEIVHGDGKDIEVTATYKNNAAFSGEAPAELLYGGAVYESENIVFDGTVGQSITRTYTISQLPLSAQNSIEVRINYENRLGEKSPDSDFKALAPLDIPIPRNDYAILFMKAFQEGEDINVEVAYQNLSYQSGTVPVRVLYDNKISWEDKVSFSGVPFEVVVKKYIGDAGEPGLRSVEAQINWADRESEENADNNSMIYYIDVE